MGHAKNATTVESTPYGFVGRHIVYVPDSLHTAKSLVCKIMTGT